MKIPYAQYLSGLLAPPVVVEDTEFAPGHVVIADGSKRRMMITKIVVGFAECVWFPPGNLRPMRHEIVHTSALTLDKDQQWLTK